MKLDEKLSRDWHLDNFYGKGYEVEFWDVSNIIQKNNQVNTTDKNIRIIDIETTSSLIKNILELEINKVFIIITIPYVYQSLSIYRILSKYNLNTVFFSWGEMPNLIHQKNILTKLLNLYKINKNIYQFIKNMYQRQVVKLYRKLNLINKYSICFAAGDLCNSLAYSDKLTPINLCDYDQNLKNSEQIVKGKYAVFLDINLPFNSDVELQGLVKIDPQEYYMALNKFFDLFEKKYDLKIVIAAHPKSNYKKDIFGNREIYFLKTPQLIKFCEHVLLHYSTALSYAILNYKPVTFFTTDQMKYTYEYHMGKLLSEHIKQPFVSLTDINIDNFSFKEDIDHDVYDKYKYNYIVSKESEGKLSFPLIENTIATFTQHEQNIL